MGEDVTWRAQFRKFATNRSDAKAQPGNRVFEEFLVAKRNRMHRTFNAGRSGVQGAAARRMIVRRLRTIKTQFKERSAHKIPVEVLAYRRRDTLLIEKLSPKRIDDWLPPLKRTKMGADVQITFKEMSFLDHPAETLQRIMALLKAESGAADIRVHFDDPKCRDVSPYLLLAMMWGDLTPIFSGGRMTPEMQRVVEAVKLRRLLKMGKFKYAVDEWEMRAFPLHRRRPANSSSSPTRYLDPQTREEVSDAFVRAINDWLDQDEINQELTPAGRGSLKNIIGEVLDNAERHSMPLTMDGDWTIAGYMARRDDEPGVRFECSIAFISIGSTISESLETSPPAVAHAVDRYVQRHRQSVSEEVLRTVMSVQEGITRVAESAAENRGGSGFSEVLDLVNDLGDANLAGCAPRVTIVSGSACLKLHHPYSQGRRSPEDPFSPREIWCNETNDSREPPDGQYAFSLPQAFPGTIVTMSFVFEPTATEDE